MAGSSACATSRSLRSLVNGMRGDTWIWRSWKNESSSGDQVTAACQAGPSVLVSCSATKVGSDWSWTSTPAFSKCSPKFSCSTTHAASSLRSTKTNPSTSSPWPSRREKRRNGKRGKERGGENREREGKEKKKRKKKGEKGKRGRRGGGGKGTRSPLPHHRRKSRAPWTTIHTGSHMPTESRGDDGMGDYSRGTDRSQPSSALGPTHRSAPPGARLTRDESPTTAPRRSRNGGGRGRGGGGGGGGGGGQPSSTRP